MRLTCVKCATIFPAQVPIAERINANTFSAFVWSHPAVKRCPTCGQEYQFVVQGLKDMAAGYVPVKPPEENKLIQPATRMPTA